MWCDIIKSVDNPTGIYLLRVNNRNSRTRCEIGSQLTIKIPKRRQWRRSGIFIVNFERISHLVLLLSIVNFEHVIAGRAGYALMTEFPTGWLPTTDFLNLLASEHQIEKASFNSSLMSHLDRIHDHTLFQDQLIMVVMHIIWHIIGI